MEKEFGIIARKCVAAGLSVLFPALAMAADFRGTIILSNGNVSVNGLAIRGSHTILAGDRVETTTGNAVIRLSGGTVSLADNTSVQLDPAALAVNSGRAEIHGTQHLRTRFDGVDIRPSSDAETAFVVGAINGKPAIAALRGAITIDDGVNSMVLAEGHAIQDQAPVPAVKGRSKRSKKTGNTKGDDRGESERGGRRGAATLPGWVDVALIGGAIGGTLGGFALTGAFDKHCISPSSPNCQNIAH